MIQSKRHYQNNYPNIHAESSSRSVSQEKGSLSANISGLRKAISGREILYSGLKRRACRGKKAWRQEKGHGARKKGHGAALC